MFRCDVCNQGFATEKGLKIHKTKKHPNESQTIEQYKSEEKKEEIIPEEKTELFQCPICGQEFQSKKALKKHEKRNIKKKKLLKKLKNRKKKKKNKSFNQKYNQNIKKN